MYERQGNGAVTKITMSEREREREKVLRALEKLQT